MTADRHDHIRQASKQQQFLDVLSRDEAERRFREHLHLEPLGEESLPLSACLNRILAHDLTAPVDVPNFDRSNVDGFAVRSADTEEASEEQPRSIRLNAEVLSPGCAPQLTVEPGTATPIATGGAVPRGANSVVMIEHTDYVEHDDGTRWIEVRRSVSPGQAMTFAGTDIGLGETVLRRGAVLTSREIGVVAALGIDVLDVYSRPRVAIISTGDEIVAPGDDLPTGSVYDSNAAILAAAVEELGGQPEVLGIVHDDEHQLERILKQARERDIILLSGGTSKGAGDLSYKAVEKLNDPGIVAHGVALKPGKPICLAVSDTKPFVILPGFPTSAIFTFHEFVGPVIELMAGRRPRQRGHVEARLPLRVNSERGRTEYLLVGLVEGEGEQNLAAYPIGKGSGSVTTFSHADGFLTIDRHTERIDAGTQVDVRLLGDSLEVADLVVIGSHCIGLDLMLSALSKEGWKCKVLSVGSMGGVRAAGSGECDVAGIHLLHPDSRVYNAPFCSEGLSLIRGYGRRQGLVHRAGDPRFEGKAIEAAIASAVADPGCMMVNRNAGSGTRILIDELLGGTKPPGHPMQARSHNAVASAVSQSRADWGVAIQNVAQAYGLEFIPLCSEQYDFLIPNSRRDRPAVRAFERLLSAPAIREQLVGIGFDLEDR